MELMKKISINGHEIGYRISVAFAELLFVKNCSNMDRLCHLEENGELINVTSSLLMWCIIGSVGIISI